MDTEDMEDENLKADFGSSDLTPESLAEASLKVTTCPHCAGAIHINPVAQFREQTLYFSLKYEGDSMSLTTVSQSLVSMDKLLRAVAEDVGQKAHVFLKSVEQKDGELKFGLFVTEARKKKPAPRKDSPSSGA